MAINTNELAAGVKDYIRDAVPDGLAKATPLWKHLSTDGKEKHDGGLTIQLPIKLIANTSQNFISGTGAVTDLTPSQQLVYMTLNWKYYNFNINFTLEDHVIAKGGDDAINYFTRKTDGALGDSFRQLSEAAHGTSTSNALAFEGMQDIVAASGTAYGGLTDTDYDDDAFLPYIPTATVLNYSAINNMIVTLRSRTQGSGVIDPKKMMGLMNPATYQRFMSILQNQQVFFDVKDVAESGFDGFRVNGCDFYMDSDVPGTQDGSTGDNYVYVFMKDVIKLFYKFGLGSDSPFDGDTRPANQPITSIQNYLAANMICTNRRMVAVNKTIIA